MSTPDLLARMPKAELHLHLDGSLRPSTALELARERGLDEGMDLAAMRAACRHPPRSPTRRSCWRPSTCRSR